MSKNKNDNANIENDKIEKLRFKREDGSEYPVWEMKPIANFGDIITGKTPPTKEVDNYGDDFSWITPTDINKKYIAKGSRSLSIKGSKLVHKLPAGSVLVTCIASIGKNCILTEEGSSNQQINAIIPNQDYNSEIIYYLLEANINYIRGFVSKTAVDIINKELFSSLEICVPTDREEQERIGKFFSALDTKLQMQVDKLELLKQYKKGLLQEIFSQQKRFRRDSGENYSDWEIFKLGDVCKFHNNKIDISKLSEHNYISTENMIENFGGIKTSSKLPSNGKFTKFDIGDILISNIRIYLRKIWVAKFNGGASNDVIVLKTSDNILSDFLFNILASDNCINHFMSGAKGTKMPRGDKDVMKTFEFGLPCLEEQEKIAEILSAVDDKIKLQAEKLESVRQYKKAMLQRMF